MGALAVSGLMAVTVVAALCVAIFGVLLGASGSDGCTIATSDGGGVELLPGGGGETIGATEYGGPGDPSSGTVGSEGVSLLTHPDSYAELGGMNFQTATALGGLAYGTPLRITVDGHSAIAYKRDIGLGGGPIDGLPRDIDLWWELAGALGLPDDGDWAGTVKIARPPDTGAGATLGNTAASTEIDPAMTDPATTGPTATGPTATGPTATGPTATGPTATATTISCASASTSGGAGVTTTAGPRATLLADGQATAPADAPAAVKGIIAAGNELVGKPYVYGGGHGLPLSEIAPSYDCSSSVEHLLYGGGLLPVDYGADSQTLESWSLPGPGKWVTIYASPDHVFMYVAGLRWDTHNAAGPADGMPGIGWHPLVREADGFVARHPAGL